jgi:hypothetical protein
VGLDLAKKRSVSSDRREELNLSVPLFEKILMRKLAASIVLSVCTGTSAFAAPILGQISFGGYAAPIGSLGMGAASGLDFVQNASSVPSPGVAGGLSSYGGGLGSFVALACTSVNGNCGSISDILSFSTSAPIASFLIIPDGGTTVTFDLSSITGVTRSSDATGGSFTLTATGLIHETGFDNTAGVLSLTSQGSGVTSFAATLLAGRAVAAAVPEPESVALLGLGIAAIGVARRKRTR